MFIVLIRTIILYFIVVLVMRLMGKRQIGELQPYELVITIMISDLASLPMSDARSPLLLGIIPIVTLLFLKIILSELQLKSTLARKILDGSPCILIKNGMVNINSLAKQRINIDDLMEELRLSGFFNISDIQYAILENNGSISVIPKNNSTTVTKGDLNLKEKEENLPVVLVVDGRLNYKSLNFIKKDKKWFIDKLKEYNINSEKDLFLAMIDSRGEFFYQFKNKINSKGNLYYEK